MATLIWVGPMGNERRRLLYRAKTAFKVVKTGSLPVFYRILRREASHEGLLDLPTGVCRRMGDGLLISGNGIKGYLRILTGKKTEVVPC